MHTCSLCGKSFSTKYTLSKHNEKKIPCAGKARQKFLDRNKTCTHCHKIFSSKQALQKHLEVCKTKAIKENNQMVLKELKEEFRVMMKEFKSSAPPTIINNNTQNNIQNNFFLAPHGKEDTSKITGEMFKKIIFKKLPPLKIKSVN